MNSREQGDIGERAAAAWLLTEGACVAYPFGHSPDWDLVAEIDGTLYRVHVKTSTCYRRDRWIVMTCTHGGNRSWNGVIKRLDCTRCDYLFVLVGDGRQWFIPAPAVGGGSAIVLGGPKYARFEIDRGRPIEDSTRESTARRRIFVTSAGCPSG